MEGYCSQLGSISLSGLVALTSQMLYESVVQGKMDYS
jgi:hypothetical protein